MKNCLYRFTAIVLNRAAVVLDRVPFFPSYLVYCMILTSWMIWYDATEEQRRCI